MKRKVAILNAKTWNAMIDEVSRRLPLRFVKTSRRWVHPWTIVPEYSDLAEQWVFRIRPGFVNGVEPEIPIQAQLASERTLDRIEEETGTRPEKNQPVDALITEAPQIPVSGTRVIGKGANPDSVSVSPSGNVQIKFEVVPEFFIQFGVTDEKLTFQGNLNSGIQEVQSEEPKEPPPLLRACDVVLYLDRPAAKLEVIQGNPFQDSFSALLVINYGRSTPARKRPYLKITAKYQPIVEADLGNLLEGAADPEFDEIKIATIYFISPPGFAARAADGLHLDSVRQTRPVLESRPRPAENPRPHTHRADHTPNRTGRRNCGYHLQQPASPWKRRLQFRSPGATHPQFGREVLVAMSEEPKDGFGLNKEQRLLAKRLDKEEEEAEQAAGLEPPFPYVMEQFDAGYFEL